MLPELSRHHLPLAPLLKVSAGDGDALLKEALGEEEAAAEKKKMN